MDTKLDNKKLDYRSLMEQQRASNNRNKTNSSNKNDKETRDFDIKIVSFMLGQQYYAIDIMAVKEIINASKFTRIPNALDFVMGVLNIRGEIIPIIYLGKMFHLSEAEKVDEDNQIIVIKIDNLVIGLVVDKISQVIPLQKSDIQPPSPLLGGINERYIDGVAEINSRLYVILDIEYIFSDKEKTRSSALVQGRGINEQVFIFFCNQIETLANVHVNDFNREGFVRIYTEYAKALGGAEMPQLDSNTAQTLTSGVISQYTQSLWDRPYIDYFSNTVFKELQKYIKDEIKVLDIGCGSGHEAFTVYFMLSQHFNNTHITMTAADTNLNAVQSALNFEVNDDDMPSWINADSYFVKLGSTYRIKQEIFEAIAFEFHNAVNMASYQEQFDLVVARDLSLFTSNDEYKTFLEGVSTKIVSGGVLVIGDNEIISDLPGFDKIDNENIHIFRKK